MTHQLPTSVSRIPIHGFVGDVGSLLIAQLKEAGSRIIEIDYSDTATIESSATELKAQNITIDVLINCGGMI